MKYGKGTEQIEEDKVKEIREAILSDKDERYVDLDNISEIIGQVFGWRYFHLNDIPLRSAKAEGTFENGDLKITLNVSTNERENSFKWCFLSIYKKPLQEVDIDHWERTGC